MSPARPSRRPSAPRAAAAAREKNGLHPRNKHRHGYDFAALMAASPALAAFVAPNAYGNVSIDFADPQAVLALNRALLAHHYRILHWDLPPGYLCPPIPGRVDYLHHLADLLAAGGEIPRGKAVRVLDIGVGANAIYPLLGAREYGWRFVGSDIDPVSVKAAQLLAQANGLSQQLELRVQTRPTQIFAGIIAPGEHYAFSLCNPPFHASLAEASTSSARKWRNLNKTTATNSAPVLNFGGQKAELWCDGGEAAFLARMIQESQQFADQVGWFSSLVSKADNLPAA
ncbi:MAG: 23S rRNA (adenine(1618)-N(6))-methyltransferase RlmF, partial [Shewanella sp.]